VADAEWIDLLDPTAEEVTAKSPRPLRPAEVETLTAPASAREEPEPRPRLQGHVDHVLGVLLAPVVLRDENRVYYQELDVVLAEDAVLTVRKTPAGEEPFDAEAVRAAVGPGGSAAEVAFRIVDEIAERYLDLVDGIDEEIEELEDHLDDWPQAQIRRRIQELRQDLLQVRRTLAPTRDAVREVVDGRLDLDEGELFTREGQLMFATVYDKLLRATEGLDFSRELLAGVRDYAQARVANEQNEVVKRLTAVASLLLLPTFIVGVYGQNFDHMPELDWRLGYAWSWGLIVVTTVGQLAFFRWRRWL